MQDDEWLIDAKLKLKKMPEAAKEVRERAKLDLFYFAQLVNPGYMYGSVHEEIYAWMQNYSLFGRGDEATSNKLIMLPRAHLKSHMVATWCAWVITNNPEVTMLYLSATSELAQTQLYAVQNMMASSTYMRYFPEYINPQEGKREKWSAMKMTVDHIKRKQEGTRDPTIATAGLTTNTTGWHADIVVADDLVVPENAYTVDGRDGVARKTSQFTSIRNTGGFTMACGTRYHPKDIYDTWKTQCFDDYGEDGLLIDNKPVWEVKEFAVEEDGIFIWPRAVRGDGKAFGFNQGALARIKAEYIDNVQFYAQYYNDPNDPGSERINRDKFQYYNPRMLRKNGSRWMYNDRKLNVYAAVDFAFSLNKAADWTAIVVIGIDHEKNIYVLDMDRFKTDRVKDYFDHIARLHSQYGFSKLRAEVNVAQAVIVNGIKEHVKKSGMTLPIDEFRPSKQEGNKEERIKATLEHRYDNLTVWHREGGWTPQLEEELIMARPAHDDLKDSLASAVDIAIAPKQSMKSKMSDFFGEGAGVRTGTRFGGVAFK